MSVWDDSGNALPCLKPAGIGQSPPAGASNLRRDWFASGERRIEVRLWYRMTDDPDTQRRTGNEPAPLLMLAVAIIPLLGVAGWLLFG
jgi:hypothetical protein